MYSKSLSAWDQVIVDIKKELGKHAQTLFMSCHPKKGLTSGFKGLL